MDAEAVTQYITETFAGVDVAVAAGYTFFFYDPGPSLPLEKKFPFATLITKDNEYDRVSNLDRPGVFRLNVGVSRQTYRSLFPKSAADTVHDFTALDRIMPHPDYAAQSWVCVLNPGDATFAKVRELLEEGYSMAMKRHGKLTRE